MRYVPPKELADLLLGSLYLGGLAYQESLGLRLERAAAWYAELFGAGNEGVPFEVVFDLGHLLLEGAAAPLGMSLWLDAYPPPERALRSRYQNGYLVALLERPWFLRAHDLVAVSQAPDLAVVYALECLLGSISGGKDSGLVLQPSRFLQLPWGRLAREAEEVGVLKKLAEHRQRFEAWQGEGPPLEEALRSFLDRASLVSGKVLLGELEFFELAHIHQLDSRERRLAARQLKQAELLLGSVDLAALGRPPEVEEVDSNLTDEGTFPSGGLGGLANRGSWENLVPSELLYMGAPGETDLFEVRFAEGELLFYTRDGATLRRRRRRFLLLLDLDEDMQVKFPEHPLPVDRLLEGLLARLTADVLAIFRGDACEVLLLLRGTGAEESAERLGLRFQEEIHRGEVQLEVPRKLSPEQWIENRRKNTLVWVGRQMPLATEVLQELRASRVTTLGVLVGGGAGAEEGRDVRGLPLDEDLVAALEECRDHLVGELVG
jgi:hypothetical protein